MSTPTTLAAAVADRAQRAPSCEADREGENDAIFAALAHAIDHAAHLLPAQGPISVFIHHNTLHAFEEATFTEALKTASQTFGCHPYLPEARYREELLRGRIRFGDMEAVLREDLGATASARIVPGCTRLELRLAMLQYPLRLGPTPELLWFVAETDALRRVRSDVSAAARAHLLAEARRWAMRDLRGVSTHLTPLLERFGQSQIENWSEAQWEAFTLQALWRICCNRLGALPDPTPAPRWPVRHRDLLLQATGEDADLLVHEILIRFCAAYLDQGLAHWRLPLRDEGFYRAFIALYRQAGGPPNHWLRGLARQLEQLADQNVSPLACIHQSLGLLGVPADEWPAYINASLLGLRGWAGMIRFVEQRGDRAVQPIPAGSLVEFLAIRLILDRLAAAHVSRRALGVDIPLAELRDNLRLMLPSRQPASVEQRAFTVFQLAQALGLAPPELEGLSDDQWKLLLAEIEAFSTVERQRIFHLAYERRFATQTLDAIAQHNAAPPPAPPVPRFQAMFCIDEREESLRRHLEEIAPDCSTYGIAGFYFVAMYYRGVDDAHFTPLCPAVIQPQHWVAEKVDEHLETALERRARARRALGEAAHRIHLGSRRFATGALLSGVVGLLASVPLIARTFVPRLTAKFRKAFGKWVFDLPPTRLQLQRSDAQPGPENGAQGFTLGELCGIAERVLRDTGLTSNFAPLVLTIGHGSTSMNNPHESAHDCGACGGGRGGPNGRAIAEILNNASVRAQLRERGIDIPDDTLFVGGMHNTSNESITFFDLPHLSEAQRRKFDAVRAAIEQAGDRDAHERCRRFDNAPLTLSPVAARQHVEGRAEDLAQVRPEWGHATNAICIVGRRSRTRGLYLDRRAFLNSYDPTQDDDEATILTRILQAALPVCAGISLEYYFSYVDNYVFGCGTKLPHNITSLLGVMDGAASDLRTGLPWQMVEIHEPMRILFVIETTPEKMQKIIDRQPGLARLIKNEWVQLALVDPSSPTMHAYRAGRFEIYRPQSEDLPRAATSVDWYRGWRDHLEFARIGD